MSYRAVLWDLDGTLTDSQEGILRCTQYALKACGIEESDPQKLIRFIGPPLAYSFATFYQMQEPMVSFAVEKYRERYGTVGWKENRLESSRLSNCHGNGKAGILCEKDCCIF